MDKGKIKQIRFSAINPYIESNMVSPDEKKLNSSDIIQWGDNNSYPDYLLSLYEDVPTLQSVIDGCVDYVLGNGITLSQAVPLETFNKSGEKITDIVRKLATDFFTYGGYAMEVIRTKMGGNIAEVNHIPICYLRSNKKNDVFYYSEEWSKRYGRNKDAIVLEKFIKANTQQERGVVFEKHGYLKTYPTPLYASAVPACEIEKNIDQYHLNNLNNAFMSSAVVNFNNGIPEDEQMDEVEKDFNDKFSGTQNAGRIVFCWNASRENQTTIQKLDTADFSDKYNALAKRSRQQIFTAFRANPNLFGIPTEGTGFNSEEYESAFKLFNKTQIQPVQSRIIDTFDRIFGVEGSLIIDPFRIETEKTEIR